MSRRTRAVAVLPVLLLIGGLVSCGSESAKDETRVPVEGELTTGRPVLVLEQDQEAVACLAGVADSRPPQCQGQPLSGWDWDEHPEHESADGVRWGDFVLTGLWDGERLEVLEAVPAGEHEPIEPPQVPVEAACPEPADGWQVTDASKVSSAALDETLRRAGQLPGYSEAWLVRDVESDLEIVNVRVAADVAGAERTLRESWGGALCVSAADFTEGDLVELVKELQELPGVLNTSAFGGTVQLTVVRDDGPLQRLLDDEYGVGRIQVHSALTPVEG